MPLHPAVERVTERIRARSRGSRRAYLERIAAARPKGPVRDHLGCGNLAHVAAACGAAEKSALLGGRSLNVGLVTAYNDMLSAHQPFVDYPQRIAAALRDVGATAQVAGGVPAMCDGVTQGRPGMDLSLFSRDVIAQATAVALSHDAFDAVLCLGVCDKIVPGLLIGALAFGHLPVVFVPAGPMPSGIPNKTKAEVRERYANGEATRDELLAVEAASYHAPGTCTFYGTANSNQMLLEAMGLQLPGTSFVPPATPLRDALTAAAARRAVEMAAGGHDPRPLGRLVDERALVNAVVALLATGGSTNHAIHFVAVARAAGIVLTWEDFDELAAITPLLARIYPNGEADVNRFQAAGGIGFILRELLDAGLVHDVETIAAGGLRAYTREPWLESGALAYRDTPAASADRDVVRSVGEPFEATGGLRLVTGNLGRALVKVSAVKPEHRRIEAPAVVVDDPEALRTRHRERRLPEDFVVVLRGQGPRANGMPEMHSLMPLLGMLQNQGRRVALVTDGRLSGASGKVLAAIHVTPEAVQGAGLARVRDGDIVLLDAEHGVLEARVDASSWQARDTAFTVKEAAGWGRELFAYNRAWVGPADEGALSISCGLDAAVNAGDDVRTDRLRADAVATRATARVEDA